MIIPQHEYTARERTVCDLLAPLTGVRRMLNVGMRHPGDPRNLWWINICKTNDIEAHVLEVFEPNCQELRAAAIENVTCGDVRDVARFYEQPFDVVLWWHGPENLPKDEVPPAMEGLWQLTNGVLLVGCPLGAEPQGICYGNHHERNLSAWLPEELAALGFETGVVRDGQPYPHITAWRKRQANVERSGADEGQKSQSQIMFHELGYQESASVQSMAHPVAASQSFAEPAAVFVCPKAVSMDDHRIPLGGPMHQQQPTPSDDKRRIVPDPAFIHVALIYDGRPRPETTGTYVLRALEQMAASGEVKQVRHVRPDEIGQFAGRSFDLCLIVDDGLDYPLPAALGPVAYWAIDTHIDFERSLRRARQADFVFAAQKDGAERLRHAGIATARWLPLACDPEIHGRHVVPKKHDLCFVGNLFPGPRTDLVRLLEQYFPSMFVGNAYFEEMAQIYSASKIVFNRSLANDINMRVFEALASGSLLVTNDLSENGQHELFQDGVHFVEYRNAEELLDKLRYFLRNDELRERIAAAGRAEVLAKHTYVQRMRQLLVAVAGRPGEVGPPVGPAGDGIGESPRPPQADRLLAHTSPPNGNTCEKSKTASPPTMRSADAANSLAFGNGHHAGAIGHEESRSGEKGVSALGRSKAEIRQTSQPETDDGPRAHDHDPDYFDFTRPEILALIPLTAVTVLEIGCGTGRLGESLKARQSCEVVGVDIDEQAAVMARPRLDLVVVGDLEQMELPPWDARFDVITLGDVLEHFGDPARQLIRIRSWLKPNGLVVASIPNVRHHSVVRSLLDGNFTYEPAGLLDATHLHFFTRRNIQQLFDEASYTITSWTAVPGPGYDEWVQQGRPRTIDLGRLQLADLPEEEAQEFFVYQWLVTATPLDSEPRRGEPCHCEARHDEPSAQAEITASALVTEAGNERAMLPAVAMEVQTLSPAARLPSCLLLMVTFNRLDYTRLSLESVLALDYPDLRIVIWDNASNDGTIEFLQQRLQCEPRARLIVSPTNRGIVYPMNAVWWANHGAELLIKVDNDTRVPPELLRRLAECHQRSERFGVLSGFHFRAEGESLADESHVQEFDGMRILAQPYVGGCAVMVRKTVLDRLGPIPCRNLEQPGPFMDSGWTFYQQQMTELGLVNGYPWPLIHVDHMEDTRSPRCVRTSEHEQYKQALRGMSLEEFTQELCVWRPSWMQQPNGNGSGNAPDILPVAANGHDGNGRSSPVLVAPATNGRSPDASAPQNQLASSVGPVEAANTNGSKPRLWQQNRACPMKFVQDFRRDFDQIDFFGPPFALARFADGERAICLGLPIKGADGWHYAGGSSPFRDALLAALRFNDADYYLGLSDGCCDWTAKEWYLAQITVPLAQVTFSNLFVNGNYERFRRLDLSEAVFVASEGGDYWVPDDVLNSSFDIDALVARLLNVDRTILVSAGPAAAVIIHRYWQRAAPEKRQVIVDVGSAIDELTKGHKTRQYQMPGTRTAELICTW